MTSFVENNAIAKDVKSGRQIASLALPPTLCCGGHGAMTTFFPRHHAVSAAVKRRRKGAARGNLLAMKKNIKVVLGVINSKQIATHSFAMTSLVENNTIALGVNKRKQITTSFHLPPSQYRGGHGA